MTWVLRMLLAERTDKVAERLVFNAYARAIQGFRELRYDGADGRGLSPSSRRWGEPRRRRRVAGPTHKDWRTMSIAQCL